MQNDHPYPEPLVFRSYRVGLLHCRMQDAGCRMIIPTRKPQPIQEASYRQGLLGRVIVLQNAE